MKKILSFFLAVCLIFAVTACGAEDQPLETFGVNDGTVDSSSAALGEKDISSTFTFTATVVRKGAPLLVQTDDPDMLRCADRFTVSLPDGMDADDFKVGDVIEITFRGSILETYPAQIPDVLSIRHISHTEQPQAMVFFARILDEGRSLFVHGNMGSMGGDYSGWANLPKEISADDYKKGDYVAITFPGYIMETYPPQINVTSIRHLTETEIVNFLGSVKPEEKRIRLQYMGTDEGKIIGICEDRAYAIALSELEEIPEMTFGDYFTVVYEERLPGTVPTLLLFVKALYLSDEYGNRIE